MRVCLICVDFFINKSGGFGRATRTIGRDLAKLGVEVFAIVPQQGDQELREVHDGVNPEPVLNAICEQANIDKGGRLTAASQIIKAPVRKVRNDFESGSSLLEQALGLYDRLLKSQCFGREHA